MSAIEWRVVNTSPLIYLSRAGLFDLLLSDDAHVVVPAAVANEINAWPTTDEAQKFLNSESRLKIVQSEAIPASVIAWDLGSGESAVLAYGLMHNGFIVVVDDLAARRCAAALGIPVRGTLGLVLRAKKQGRIPSAREALGRLRVAGMFLSDAVLNAALSEIGE